ncbi:retrotransposon protein, putative, ty1-copia subclass [Tanacetum coccineum]
MKKFAKLLFICKAYHQGFEFLIGRLNRGIASVAIIDRKLPFKYTIASRSTDVMVLSGRCLKEKLSSSNFNDWFHSPKLVLRVEKKLFVIEQPIPPTHVADSEAQVLAEWNEVACLMFGSMTPELHRQFENSSPYEMLQELKFMFEKQAGVEWFDLIQTFHACIQEEGKSVSSYVLKMKGYVEQLERLGYVLPQDLSVGLIMNGLTSDFARFVRNYNMHNIGKTIGELHALLIEYEKGLPKKAATPQVMAIQGSRIQKANKKSLNAKGKDKGKGKGKDKSYIPKPKNLKPSAKENPEKDDACHHCKEVGHWKRNCHVYLTELVMKKKQVGTASSSVSCLVDNGFIQSFMDYGISVSKNDVLYFNVIPCNGIYEIDMLNLVPNVNSIYNVSNKRVKHNLDSTYLWHCRLAHISKKRIEKLQHGGLLKSMDEKSFDKCVSCLSGKMTRKPFPHRTERATDLLGLIHTDVCGPLRHVSRQDRGGEYISQEFKDYLKAYGIVQQLTPPYTPQHNDVSERRNQSATRILNMVPTKKVDKTPYELWYGEVPNLSYLKVWGCEALVKRDTSDKLQQRSVKCIFIGYLKETMGYYFYFPPENKIVVARYVEFLEKNLISQEASRRTVEIKEIQDEDTSPSENTSEIPMEVEGFKPPQEEVVPVQTFSPVADIRAIKILIAIATFYDYEIWQMDVKTAFLNGYLGEDIYMVQPKGFVDPKHPRKVCKLQRSIYGLKKASRSWNKRFDEEIKKFGFAQNLDESCVYQKASGINVTFLILYVDDIIIMGNHIPSLQSVKSYPGKCFAMKDLGKQHLFLESRSTEIDQSD